MNLPSDPQWLQCKHHTSTLAAKLPQTLEVKGGLWNALSSVFKCFEIYIACLFLYAGEVKGVR